MIRANPVANPAATRKGIQSASGSWREQTYLKIVIFEECCHVTRPASDQIPTYVYYSYLDVKIVLFYMCGD